MPDASVRWYGESLLAEIEDAGQDGLFEMAQELVDLAAKRAPERSGRLSKSGYAATQDKSSYVKKEGHLKEVKPDRPGVAVAAFAMFYARFREYGTRYSAAKPFLRPALDESKERLMARFVGAVKVKLRR